MTDKLSRAGRSKNMSRIRAKNTSPELAVRRFLYSRGVRYRLHAARLPGKPDIVLFKRRVCIFVHGCFWHGCAKCIDGQRAVKSNTDYWGPKIAANQARDRQRVDELRRLGWKVMTIWECELRDQAALEALYRNILC